MPKTFFLLIKVSNKRQRHLDISSINSNPPYHSFVSVFSSPFLNAIASPQMIMSVTITSSNITFITYMVTILVQLFNIQRGIGFRQYLHVRNVAFLRK